MAEIAITRRSEPTSRRCPWCHEGEAEGEEWAICPRDQTPVHRACLQEYGVCPICRGPVASLGDRISVSPRIPPLVVERLTLPALGDERTRFLRQIRSSYRPLWLQPALIAGGVVGLSHVALMADFGFVPVIGTLIAYLSLLGLLFAAFSRPRSSRWQNTRPDEEARILARRIADNDLLTLRKSRQLFKPRHNIAEINRSLGELEDQDRDQRRRTVRERREERWAAFRRATPIEDARRIRGIGVGVVEALRAADIHSLDDFELARRDLLTRPIQSIRGIGPRRAELLASWAAHRIDAIERLVAAEPMEQIPGSRHLAQTAEALAARGREELREAEAILDFIDRWRREREPNLALLRALRSRGS